MAVCTVALSSSFLGSISLANSNSNNNKGKLAFAKRHSALPTNKRIRRTVSCSVDINRSSFPDDFFFGAASSAFQTESGASDGGRGPSIMDNMLDGKSAAKSLYKYNEDVLCLKNMGMDVYRFSISWTRLFPSGKVNPNNVNQEGLTFYFNLLKLLELNGITPIVTLFHFDFPMDLQSEYHGTIEHQFVDDFKEYVDFCFKTFGEHVKHWITINEPHMYCKMLYSKGLTYDDRGRFPYLSGHHLLIAHAEAVKIYKQKYQLSQRGKIGITLDASWNLPYSDTRQDRDAVRRAWDFVAGWFMDPLVTGDYPFSMKMNVGDRLPSFTNEEQKLIKDSFDFIGINYYSANYARYQDRKFETYDEDGYFVTDPKSVEGELIGPQMEGFASMHVYAPGLKEILLYLKNDYGNPLIYITENGYAQKRNDDVPTSVGLQDDVRIKYIRDHLNAILDALKEGANVKGYCVWNLQDAVEFGGSDPYGARFGLNYTDYANDYHRIPKKSAEWFKTILNPKTN